MDPTPPLHVATLDALLSPAPISNPGNGAVSAITLVSGGGGESGAGANIGSSSITSFVQQDAPANIPSGMATPMGLLAFSVELLGDATSESFSLYVDANLGINGYWQQNAGGTWVNIASAPYGGSMVMEGGRLRLDFQITDGGEFDADGQVNGSITDPGAPAYLPLSIVGLAPEGVGAGWWF